MEIFEREYQDERDAVIIEAAIVFEVHYIDDDGDKIVNTPMACTNDSRVYQTGLFQWAARLVQETGGAVDEEDDDDSDAVD